MTRTTKVLHTRDLVTGTNPAGPLQVAKPGVSWSLILLNFTCVAEEGLTGGGGQMERGLVGGGGGGGGWEQRGPTRVGRLTGGGANGERANQSRGVNWRGGNEADQSGGVDWRGNNWREGQPEQRG